MILWAWRQLETWALAEIQLKKDLYFYWYWAQVSIETENLVLQEPRDCSSISPTLTCLGLTSREEGLYSRIAYSPLVSKLRVNYKPGPDLKS